MDSPTAKASLKTALVLLLKRDLAAAEKSHKATIEGVTHAEAKPENDKDTRALEQSYLARGQAQRVEELRTGIAEVESMGHLLPSEAAGGRAVLGALVTVLEKEQETTYWIAAQGGGAELPFASAPGGVVHVVTPRSPLGRALVGKVEGDEVEITIAGKPRAIEVLRVE